jgi:hypothetical protein
MLAKERSLELVTTSRRCQEACYGRRNTLENNPTSRIPTHNGRKTRAATKELSRQGKERKSEDHQREILCVVVNDDSLERRRGKKRGEERRGQSLLGR